MHVLSDALKEEGTQQPGNIFKHFSSRKHGSWATQRQIETDGEVQIFFFVLLSPSQAGLGSQTSWDTMPRELEKVGLLGHRRCRSGSSVSVDVFVHQTHGNGI